VKKNIGRAFAKYRNQFCLEEPMTEGEKRKENARGSGAKNKKNYERRGKSPVLPFGTVLPPSITLKGKKKKAK